MHFFLVKYLKSFIVYIHVLLLFLLRLVDLNDFVFLVSYCFNHFVTSVMYPVLLEYLHHPHTLYVGLI